MERFNMSMRKYLKEVGVTSQQAIEQAVREEKLAGKGKLKVKMVLTGEGTRLNHAVEGEIDLSDAPEGGPMSLLRLISVALLVAPFVLGGLALAATSASKDEAVAMV